MCGVVKEVQFELLCIFFSAQFENFHFVLLVLRGVG